MQDACKKGIDPLTFYAIHGLQIPIFARISSEVLPVSTVSGDVERIFSISGKVCSRDRSCLSGDSVNMLTSLYYWLKEEHCYESRKDAARKERDRRFCKISLDLIIQDAVEDEDDTTGGEDEEY